LTRLQQAFPDTALETTVKTLKILTAAILASFAVAAQADPSGPGGPGCPAGATPGMANCPAYGAGGGYGRGHGGHGMQERLKAADKNADGMISREEARESLPRLYENFDAIDANKDGYITFEEMRNARQAHRGGGAHGEGWKKWDANGDGKLSREEVAKAPRLSQDFDAIDTNKDGFLSVEELQAARGRFAGKGGKS
jgi:Ca2+-binding EF-hand superfamily protein